MSIIRGQRVSGQLVENARALRRTMTPAERMLWDALRTNRLAGFHFRRQQIIEGFIADFYCARAKLAIEVDGAIHAQRPTQDRERDAVFASLGIRTIRFSNAEVEGDLDRVLQRIQREAAANQT